MRSSLDSNTGSKVVAVEKWGGDGRSANSTSQAAEFQFSALCH